MHGRYKKENGTVNRYMYSSTSTKVEKLIYVSYRGCGKGAIKGGCEPNTKPILWGIQHIDKDKPLVITEGQPDAMAVYEAGYKKRRISAERI